MIKYNDRRYFTLDDVKRDIPILPITEGPFAMEVAGIKMAEFISNVIKKCGWTTPLSDWNNSLSKYIDICWQEHIWPKFYDKAICYTDDDTIADEDSAKVFASFMGPIIAWMSSSDTKFSLLIANQEANKTKLLGQIKSSSVSRFNDTPQNQGQFEDDSHNTNVTKTENATDGTTLLARLNEIENNLKRLYEDWSNEFRKFIIWSAAENE